MSAPADLFVRRASVVRVIDGDTYEMRIDLGYRVEARLLIRLRGYDAPELPTPKGIAAQQKAARLFARGGPIVVRSHKDTQSFARWVADVYVGGVSMVDLMQQPEAP